MGLCAKGEAREQARKVKAGTPLATEVDEPFLIEIEGRKVTQEL